MLLPEILIEIFFKPQNRYLSFWVLRVTQYWLDTLLWNKLSVIWGINTNLVCFPVYWKTEPHLRGKNSYFKHLARKFKSITLWNVAKLRDWIGKLQIKFFIYFLGGKNGDRASSSPNACSVWGWASTKTSSQEHNPGLPHGW